MSRPPVLALALGLAFGGAAPALAQVDLLSPSVISGQADLRLSAGDGETSGLQGGFGKTRYGGNGEGRWTTRAQLASADLIWRPALAFDLTGYVDAVAQPGQRNAIDLSEAFLLYKPLPRAGGLRWQARAGLFYPRMSMENDGPGWTPSRTITPSAIDTWVGRRTGVIRSASTWRCCARCCTRSLAGPPGPTSVKGQTRRRQPRRLPLSSDSDPPKRQGHFPLMLGTGAIDFSHLENYVGGDQAIVREVLALFSDQARTVLPALDPAGPSDQWRNAAHSLKGSALGIGALALASACGDAEMAREATVEVKEAARGRIADCLGAALTDIAIYTGR